MPRVESLKPPLNEEKKSIRQEMQDVAKQNNIEYDPNKLRDAKPEVKLGLAKRWINKAAPRLGVESPDVMGDKIFRSLGINMAGIPRDEQNNVSSEDQDIIIERIKQFQRDHELDDDGIIGPKTLEALDNATEGTFDKPLTNKEGTPYETIGAPAEEEAAMLQEGAEEAELTPQEQRKAARKKAKQEAKEALRDGEKRQDTIADAVLATNAELEKADQDVGAKEVDFKTKEEEKKSAGEAELKATQDAEKAKGELVQAEVELSNKARETEAARVALEEAQSNQLDGDEVTTAQDALEKAEAAQAAVAEKKVGLEKTYDSAEAGKQAAMSKNSEATKKAEESQKELEAAKKNYDGLSTKKGQLEADLSKAALEQRQAEIAAEKPRTPETSVAENAEGQTAPDFGLDAGDIDFNQGAVEASESEDKSDVPQEAEPETEEVVGETTSAPEPEAAPATPDAPEQAPAPATPDAAPAPAPAPSASSEENERIPEPKVPKETPADDL